MLAFFVSVFLFFLWLCVSRCVRKAWRRNGHRRISRHNRQSQSSNKEKHKHEKEEGKEEGGEDGAAITFFNISPQFSRQTALNVQPPRDGNYCNGTPDVSTPLSLMVANHQQLTGRHRPLLYAGREQHVQISNELPLFAHYSPKTSPDMEMNGSIAWIVPNATETHAGDAMIPHVHDFQAGITHNDVTSPNGCDELISLADDGAVLSSSSVSPTLSGYYSASTTSNQMGSDFSRTYTPSMNKNDLKYSFRVLRMETSVPEDNPPHNEECRFGSQVYKKRSVEATV